MSTLAIAAPSVTISDWMPLQRYTALGTFTVTLPDGLMILWCMAHRLNEREWVSLPGAAQLENGKLKRSGDGKVMYKTVLRFTSADGYKRFQASILEELKTLGHI